MNKTGIKLQKVIDKNAKLLNMKLLKRKDYPFALSEAEDYHLITVLSNELFSWKVQMTIGMTEKGLIGYEENGKTKFFFPKVKKEQVVVQETRDFLKRIYDGSVGMMMSALVRQNDLSKEDIQELQQILKEAENKAEKDGKKGR